MRDDSAMGFAINEYYLYYIVIDTVVALAMPAN